MPKISVIVPVYNVEKYLSTCLESLLKQTLSDIEIICVDDKSPDNALSILYDYANKDSRVNVIELPENGGVARARNTGIDAATGEYISFVDPDDYVDLDYFEKLYASAQSTGADICVSNIKEHLTDGSIVLYNKYLSRILKTKYNFSYLQCAAIFKTEFIKSNKLYCPAGITNGEDVMFCIQCAYHCNVISCVKDTYYHYIRRNDSAEGLFYSEKQINSRIDVSLKIVDLINRLDLSWDDYKSLFLRPFNMLSIKNFQKTTRADLRRKSAETIMEIFKLCKYPDVLRRNTAFPYLVCQDTDGLCRFLSQTADITPTIKINLLHKIPFLSIEQSYGRKKVRLFGLTILYIRYEK